MAVNNPRRDVNLFSPKIPLAGANMELKDIDLNNLDLFVYGDPYAAWKVLREQAPVHWNPKDDSGYWSITRYQDALEFTEIRKHSAPSGVESLSPTASATKRRWRRMRDWARC